MRIKATALICLLFSSGYATAEGCPVSDAGYSETRYQGSFKGGDSTAFCRLVGEWGPNAYILCSVTNNRGTCENVRSGPIGDPGYPQTQRWQDENKDGYIDFCRTIGNSPVKYTRCSFGPRFHEIKDIR